MNPSVLISYPQGATSDQQQMIDQMNRALIDLYGQSDISPVPASVASVDNKLIWDYTVNSSTTQISTLQSGITLDGNAHGGYFAEFFFYNPTGGDVEYRMYANNDITNTNYNSVGFGVGWSNDALLMRGTPTGTLRTAFISGQIGLSPEGFLFFTHLAIANPSGGLAGAFGWEKSATITNLTRLDIVVSVAGGIGINSRFRLWRRI